MKRKRKESVKRMFVVINRRIGLGVRALRRAFPRSVNTDWRRMVRERSRRRDTDIERHVLPDGLVTEGETG